MIHRMIPQPVYAQEKVKSSSQALELQSVFAFGPGQNPQPWLQKNHVLSFVQPKFHSISSCIVPCSIQDSCPMPSREPQIRPDAIVLV